MLTKFLEWKYGRILADEDNDLMECVHAALHAANHFLGILYAGNLWLNKEQAVHASQCGFRFLQCYMKAATISFHHDIPRFKLNPKLHMYAHICHELFTNSQSPGEILNPLNFACQQDEDFVGKIATIVRRQHARSVDRRVLQRYKLNLAQHW